jgi:hypothetical protein
MTWRGNPGHFQRSAVLGSIEGVTGPLSVVLGHHALPVRPSEAENVCGRGIRVPSHLAQGSLSGNTVTTDAAIAQVKKQEDLVHVPYCTV